MPAHSLVEKQTRDGLAKVQDACQFLSISRASVYGLMEKGELPFIKIGKSRRIEWPELEALVARSRSV